MHFDDILATLRDNGKGGQAYEKAILRADQAMEDDPDRAAGYRLLISLAERYIDSTGRLPVTIVQSDQAFDMFAKTAAVLSAAYESGDPDGILRTLDTVSIASRKGLVPAAET